jgi:hypothetical protein
MNANTIASQKRGDGVDSQSSGSRVTYFFAALAGALAAALAGALAIALAGALATALAGALATALAGVFAAGLAGAFATAFAGVLVIGALPAFAPFGSVMLFAATGAAFLATGSFFDMIFPLEIFTIHRHVPTDVFISKLK